MSDVVKRDVIGRLLTAKFVKCVCPIQLVDR